MSKTSSLKTFKIALENSTQVAWREQRLSQPMPHPKDKVFYICDVNTIPHECTLLEPEVPLLHTHLREKVVNLAKKYNMAVFPAFNLDLDRFRKIADLTFYVEPFTIRLQISPNGNIQVMKHGAENLVWLHAGGQAGNHVSIKIIEETLCKDWTVTVIANTKSAIGVGLKLTRETPNGTLEMNVTVSKKDEDAGWFVIYASLNKKEFALGDYHFVGDFGFKIKMKGDINMFPNMKNMSQTIIFQEDEITTSEDRRSLLMGGTVPVVLILTGLLETQVYANTRMVRSLLHSLANENPPHARLFDPNYRQRSFDNSNATIAAIPAEPLPIIP